MGLFTPKPSKIELMQLQNLLKQADESAKLINTTIKPDVYFERVNFLFDVLLELKKYEKYKIFKGPLPSSEIVRLQKDLQQSVNDFIMRSYNARAEKISSLKTEKAKLNNMKKFADSMFDGFNNAHNFWKGNCVYPHYDGILYTPANLEKLKFLLTEYTNT